mmetsp:Transcript_16990/g.68521  ORF Transcript_16990/g.68521 Transcript_16990/m.68521 type:complete len:234 (+) Transcript_16990:89-790(+)
MTKLVGLTGGIATGKSTVSRWLVEHGIAVLDLDALVRALQSPGSPVVVKIARAFPGTVDARTGALDREALGAAVFGDAAKRRVLNDLMRLPIQRALFLALARHWAVGTRLVVLDAPLLYESRLDALCAVVVVVGAPADVQLARLLERDAKLTPRAAKERIAAQMPLAEKVRRADVVLDNAGDRAALEHQIEHKALPRLRSRLWVWWLASLPGAVTLAVVGFVVGRSGWGVLSW